MHHRNRNLVPLFPPGHPCRSGKTQTDPRACLKNYFRNLQAPLCGRFYPRSVAVARYAALIRIKSPTN
ncbi:DUF6783 domain-containing protein [Blautia sp.]